MRATIVSDPGNGNPNEDWAGVVPGVAVVLDGVTVMDGMEHGCHHGTAWYVNQLGTALLAALATAPGSDGGPGEVLTMEEALSHAIAHTAFLHSGTCDLSAEGAPTAAAAAVRVRGDELEYLVLADVTVALGLHGFTEKIITDARVEASVAGLHSGTPDVALRVAERRSAHRNRAGGYWVAGADPDVAAHAVTGSVPVPSVVRASLLTDGAARLADMFGTSWHEVIYKPPQMTLLEVRTVERSDPECTRWPRFKMSDDATIVALDTGS
jgi:hypothetical protein